MYKDHLGPGHYAPKEKKRLLLGFTKKEEGLSFASDS